MDVLGSFLDGRDDARSAQAARRALAPDWKPPATKPPDALVADLLATINRLFYARQPAKVWLRDQCDLKLVLTWPAMWLTERGIGLPADRYEAILREILGIIQLHGDMAAIRHVPSYLAHAVRQWFVHHGDELYGERKRIRNLIDLRLLDRRSDATAQSPDPTETLARAHAILKGHGRAKKHTVTTDPKLPFPDV